MDLSQTHTPSDVIRGATLRARPTPALRQSVTSNYGIHVDGEACDLGGSSNLNLLITDATDRWVVRVYRPWVTPARLCDIQLARRTLSAGGVPTPELQSALDGRRWIGVDGRLVEVERYVACEEKMDSWERITTGLPWLGRIHALLQPLHVSADGMNAPASNHLNPIETLAWTARGTTRIREWNPAPADQRLADASADLAQLVSAAESSLIPELPRQLVHGDFWDNNVFFRDGAVALVTDLDFMGCRARIDDLALTLYYTNSKYSGGRDTPHRIRQFAALVNAYNSGLDHPLTATERQALPLAIARAPLCFIGMIAAVDTEEEAHSLAAEMRADVEWALAIARHPEPWQEAFA